MKIQLALDLLDPREALRVVREASPYVDIIEVGTSLLKQSGIAIVEQIRSITCKPLFLDMKIIDGPEREATLMAQCKPDYYSMLAIASDIAVRKVLAIAADNGSQVVFDLQSVADPVLRALELKALGAQRLCIHKNMDCGDDLVRGFSEFIEIKRETGLPLSLAGGISLSSVGLIRDRLDPDIIIVGGAILKATDYAEAASAFKQGICLA